MGSSRAPLSKDSRHFLRVWALAQLVLLSLLTGCRAEIQARVAVDPSGGVSVTVKLLLDDEALRQTEAVVGLDFLESLDWSALQAQGWTVNRASTVGSSHSSEDFPVTPAFDPKRKESAPSSQVVALTRYVRTPRELSPTLGSIVVGGEPIFEGFGLNLDRRGMSTAYTLSGSVNLPSLDRVVSGWAEGFRASLLSGAHPTDPTSVTSPRFDVPSVRLTDTVSAPALELMVEIVLPGRIVHLSPGFEVESDDAETTTVVIRLKPGEQRQFQAISELRPTTAIFWWSVAGAGALSAAVAYIAARRLRASTSRST